MQKVRSFTVLPALPEQLKELETLARNMFWSWNPEFVELFKRVDSQLWSACGNNPVKMLGTVPQERLNALAENQGFICELERAVKKLNAYLERPTWFSDNYPEYTKTVMAYFSTEFGIHECLPIYSGGLGILAGDHLKSASDIGIPLVGVGLLYQKGYFRQYLNVDGWQQELYNESDFYNMPVEQVKNKDGHPLTISVEYPNGTVIAEIWQIHVGRVKLYLLNTNIAENSPTDRMITANLYGGDREMRIRQEIMLGIGGLRALTAMNIKPTICHMNEGHAAFMALERIRQIQNKQKLTFDEALEATRAGNVFTVHTPVKAGIDEFPIEMMDKYFSKFLPGIKITKKDFLGLGRTNPDNDNELFKMPILAMKTSSYRNGVSKLHGEVSREMWGALWKGTPTNEVPIASVTNGVHAKSWISEELNSLYERYLGSNWTDEMIGNATWKSIEQIPDEEFWRTHQRCKGHLIAFARRQLKAQMKQRGTYHTELNWAEEVLDPEALTIGFARRFASYKRGNLLLKNPARLVKLLSNTDKPVQIIFAGKAHPRDTEGKEIIRKIIHFATQYDVRRRIVFLEDYNINVAKYLVRGVDVWLNTPRRPMEASGTSGMKAGMNGALNMSILDGWWCEGYTPEAGWAIGAGEDYDDPDYQDVVESQAIYNMLENEVVPLFYTRSADNLPRAWIHRLKNSIKQITPKFNTHRMVAEYTQRFYNPAGVNLKYLTTKNCAEAKALAKWKANIKDSWSECEIKGVEMQIDNDQNTKSINLEQPELKVGSKLSVKALVKLEKINADDISVELYYGPVDSNGNINNGSAVRMNLKETSEQKGQYCFEGSLSCKTSGQYGMAIRILPKHNNIVNPHEQGLILWEATK